MNNAQTLLDLLDNHYLRNPETHLAEADKLFQNSLEG